MNNFTSELPAKKIGRTAGSLSIMEANSVRPGLGVQHDSQSAMKDKWIWMGLCIICSLFIWNVKPIDMNTLVYSLAICDVLLYTILFLFVYSSFN
ncbi:hypothetical protein BCR33DRAFT_729607 [Rhizoclosmatium globosum]|uniref:Uncharacterized protein n=1 Tax=Rhizoclosmatium globosum TaxID=329046 RepID=A0A1Y2AEZ0_9FUNG|nr:hypothetical protein BCR33DRAFT_729607 [Rhizoclosmatium globosum]|eukprot:ORY21149.1 hypothetical protein BCR33DRAFT_729607 [Rhizoclosmatium globosum]